MFNLLKSKQNKNKKETLFAVRSSFENLLNSATVDSNIFFADLELDNNNAPKNNDNILNNNINSFIEEPEKEEKPDNNNIKHEYSESFILESISNNKNHLSSVDEDLLNNFDGKEEINKESLEEIFDNSFSIEEDIPTLNSEIKTEIKDDHVEIPDELFDGLFEEIPKNDTASQELNFSEDLPSDTIDDCNDNDFNNNIDNIDDIKNDIIKEVEITDESCSKSEDYLIDDYSFSEENINSIPEENLIEEISKNSILEIIEENNEQMDDNINNIESDTENNFKAESTSNSVIGSKEAENENIVDDVVDVVDNTDITNEIEVQYTKPELQDNNILLISEVDRKVFLPYKISEINDYLKLYPDKYTDAYSVIRNEFILPLNYFNNWFSIARFREAYSLYRDYEGNSSIESLINAFKIMHISNLHPAIITACKNKKVLNDYIYHLKNDDLENFKYFEINYKINPK